MDASGLAIAPLAEGALQKHRALACARAKKIVEKVHGDDKAAAANSVMTQLTAFRLLHRYYDPKRDLDVHPRDEWPVVALGAAFLSCKITEIPRKALYVVKLSDIVAGEGATRNAKEQDCWIRRFLRIEDQLLQLLGFNFAFEKWSPLAEIERRAGRFVDLLFQRPAWTSATCKSAQQQSPDLGRTTVSSRALRHYLEVAEMWDVGDLDPHMLDTAVIMALKMYMKGVEYPNTEKPVNVFEVAVESFLPGAVFDTPSTPSPVATEEDRCVGEGGPVSPKDVPSGRAKLKLSKEAEKSEKSKRDRPDESQEDYEAKRRKTAAADKLLKDKFALVMALYRNRGK